MSFYPNYNQFYGQTTMQPMQQIPKMQPIQQQPVDQQYAQYTQPIYKQPVSLQGKSVDSIDVVKAMDIPLDGSISYFPLTNGTAIVTKQLQQDGSSKTIVYKPIDEETEEKMPKYVTIEELDKKLAQIDFSDIEDELQDIKKQIKNIKKSKED